MEKFSESRQMMNGDKYSKNNQILTTKGEQVKKNYVDQHDKRFQSRDMCIVKCYMFKEEDSKIEGCFLRG